MEIWYKAKDGQMFQDRRECEEHEFNLRRNKTLNAQMEMKNLDIAIWNAFYPEAASLYNDNGLITPTNAYVWLRSDIKEILADETRSGSFNEKAARIMGILMKSPYYEDICPRFIDMKKLIEHAKISMDLDAALSSVKRGNELSSALGYGLSTRELEQLVDLHEAGKHRKKIEDLLTNLNFHYENTFLKDKAYDALREENGLEKKMPSRMEIYEVQLGIVADGAKDENCDYHSPQIILIEASHALEIEEVEKALKDDIEALGCDCVYGITPLEDWELEQYECYATCPKYEEKNGVYVRAYQQKEQERD